MTPMTRKILIVLLATGAGCTSPNPDMLEVVSQAASAARSEVVQERADRAAADNDTRAVCFEHADDAMRATGAAFTQQLATEVDARAKADAELIAKATAAVDTLRAALPVAHLFARGAGPNGTDLDLGRHRWDTFTQATVNGESVDIDRGPFTTLYFNDAACATQAYVADPKSLVGSVRYVSGKKMLMTVDDERVNPSPTINYQVAADGKCAAFPGGLGPVRWYKATETAQAAPAAIGFRPSTLAVRDVVAN